jgi:phosphoribosylanthranilate isomerase
MKIKVCGIKSNNDIQFLNQSGIDMIGFIFVKSSPRNVQLTDISLKGLRKTNTEKVGVFVNEEVSIIRDRINEFGLTHVQLHGDETADIIDQLKPYCKVIKVFSVDDNFDFDISQYSNSDYFLFDTKGRARGGNGEKFNWNLIDNYKGDIPFLLSGGIHISDTDEIKKIKHPAFKGIDVNSGFEIEPGRKNHDLINELINELK